MRTRLHDPAGIWMAILASGAALTGIQLILPALPVMQRDLGLSDSQIGLVTSAYLLPSVLFAFPAGLLAGFIQLLESAGPPAQPDHYFYLTVE